MNKVNLKYGLIALAGLGISANVSATDLTCSDLTFTPDAYAAYAEIDKACLEVVDRDGGIYAKFTAKVVAQTSSGTHFRFRHADGELGPSNKSALPATFETMLSGNPVKVKDLAVRQEINIYVGNTFWTLPVVEVAAAAPPPPPPPPPAPEPEPEPEVLPTTASSLPLLALFGSLFLLLGGAMRFSRKQ